MACCSSTSWLRSMPRAVALRLIVTSCRRSQLHPSLPFPLFPGLLPHPPTLCTRASRAAVTLLRLLPPAYTCSSSSSTCWLLLSLLRAAAYSQPKALAIYPSPTPVFPVQLPNCPLHLLLSAVRRRPQPPSPDFTLVQPLKLILINGCAAPQARRTRQTATPTTHTSPLSPSSFSLSLHFYPLELSRQPLLGAAERRHRA